MFYQGFVMISCLISSRSCVTLLFLVTRQTIFVPRSRASQLVLTSVLPDITHLKTRRKRKKKRVGGNLCGLGGTLLVWCRCGDITAGVGGGDTSLV